MPAAIPADPEDRKQLLEAFHNLPEDEKEGLVRSIQHQRFLWSLQGLGEFPAHEMPGIEEKKHLLLAYKSLQWIWFRSLPTSSDKAFRIYICDRIPKDQAPEDVSHIFDTDTDKLISKCRNIRKPKWATKQVKKMLVSIKSFPYEAS